MAGLWFYAVIACIHHCGVDQGGRNLFLPLWHPFDCLRSCFSLGSLQIMIRLIKLRQRTVTMYLSLELFCLVFSSHSSFLCLMLSRNPQFVDLLGLCSSFPLLSDVGFGCCVGLLPLCSCLCECPLVLRLTRHLMGLLLFNHSDRDKAPCGCTVTSMPEYAQGP